MIAYALAVFYVVLIYVRPSEIIPQLEGIPLVSLAGAVTALAAALSMLGDPRRFVNLPNDWCLLGFLLASILSLPANGWMGGATLVIGEVLPLFCVYLFIKIAIRTPRQLRIFMAVMVALTLFQASNGILQYWTGTGFGNSTAVEHGLSGVDSNLLDGSDPNVVRRIRGTGIFGDPNDLAMSLVMVLPFLFGGILNTEGQKSRRLWALAAMAVLLYALFLTQSRGGLVGLGAVGAAYFYRRTGRLSAIVVGVLLAGVLLVAGSSRMQEMSASEDSAQGRIQAWSAGLDMLRSKPVLGVGYHQFTEYHVLVAHNSFVHTFAETGLVGGVFFVGMFFWFFIGNGAARNMSGAAQSPLALELWASGIGVVACICFLSRQYSPVLYIPLALGAARLSIEQQPDTLDSFGSRRDWAILLLLSAGVLIAAYAAVRVLAV
jgi:hypothetical protein